MMQMSFHLMCPRGMWLVLFRWRGCPSTSGPDQSSTWCPIRVVLFCHVCRTLKRKKKAKKKKVPLHYSFVIQCVKVFSRCGFRHNSVRVGVWWHGLKKKKKNKTCYYFMQHFSWFFNVCVPWLNWKFCPIIQIRVRCICYDFFFTL